MVSKDMKVQTGNKKPKQIIELSGLGKTFTYFEKGEGLTGSLMSLVHKKKLFKEAVKDLSFTISQGEFVGFIGENGAGKTTTLKMLSGILTPTHGHVRVDGHEPIQREKDFLKKISIVMGQKSQLWETLPAIETYRLIQKIYEVSDSAFRSRLKSLSKLLDVESLLHVQVRKLSLGQRMKCELIASLIHSPKILFLDEPTIGLDILSQRKIREFLIEYNKKSGATIILTSHNMDDLEDLASRIILIDEGSLGYDGPLDELVRDYSKSKYVSIQFKEKVFKKDLVKFGKLREYEPFECLIEIPAVDVPERVGKLLKRFPVKDISLSDITLEEIVAHLFEKNN
jgi:ABC-2 type transport system ATP-binding protein